MTFSLRELSALTGARLQGDPEKKVSGINTLEEAESTDASFLSNPRYIEAMKKSKAGILCVPENIELPEGNYLISKNPSEVMQQIAVAFHPPKSSGFSGVHPTAVIHETAKIHPSVQIGPYTVIDRDVEIGVGSIIGPHVALGFEVIIGRNCFLHPHVTVREGCQLQDRVILQPGSVIGSCGFGYAPDAQGRHAKLEQLGIVVLEDDVEIGANATIDRARFKETRIKKGSKIDNLVQIAHNVTIGEHNLIAAQTGIAGSTSTGKYVVMGGQTGTVGHIHISDFAMFGAKSGVSKSLPAGKYRGVPAQPINDFQRQEVHVRKLSEYAARLKALEEKL